MMMCIVHERCRFLPAAIVNLVHRVLLSVLLPKRRLLGSIASLYPWMVRYRY